MTKDSSCALFLGLLALTACTDPYPPTPRPDYTIHVVSLPAGRVAIPPTCLKWSEATTDPYDNQPLPQLGCATARNLALMVERPDDLVHGRELGPERGVHAVGTIRRYDNDQTRGLIDPQSGTDSVAASTTSFQAAPNLPGDITGAAAAASSSSSPVAPSSSGASSGASGP